MFRWAVNAQRSSKSILHVHNSMEEKVNNYLALSAEDDARVSEDVFSKQTVDTKRLQ